MDAQLGLELEAPAIVPAPPREATPAEAAAIEATEQAAFGYKRVRVTDPAELAEHGRPAPSSSTRAPAREHQCRSCGRPAPVEELLYSRFSRNRYCSDVDACRTRTRASGRPPVRTWKELVGG